MSRHSNPRVYVGPNTKEIVISLGRAFGVDPDLDSLTIDFTRRKVGATVVSTWTSLAVVNGEAHFEVPEEFRMDAVVFPKGFYDGAVFFDECIIGDVELIKAPGHYLSDGENIDDKCGDNNRWVEPDCADEQESDACIEACGCSNDDCPTCYNTEMTAKIVTNINYVDLDEDDLT